MAERTRNKRFDTFDHPDLMICASTRDELEKDLPNSTCGMTSYQQCMQRKQSLSLDRILGSLTASEVVVCIL